MSQPNVRWPAEWESHAATWIGWPHHEPDWPDKFGSIPWVYAEIVRALALSEPVRILCDNEQLAQSAAGQLKAHHVDSARYSLHTVATDRVWLRDTGPTGIHTANGFEWVGWAFNGWAKYPNHERDGEVAGAVAKISREPITFAERRDGSRLVLEGGGIETDGRGTMLVTEEWLLTDTQVRNPGMTREDYEDAFARYLGIERTIWLGEGVVGDDTHGHVDDLARFTSANTIVLAHEEDSSDENHARTAENLDRLHDAARHHPGGLNIATLPFPRPVFMSGERLPASYANFYIGNQVVLVPTFNDPNDRVALNILAELFPDRSVVGIHAVDLVWGLGTLHCLTQQQPDAP